MPNRLERYIQNCHISIVCWSNNYWESKPLIFPFLLIFLNHCLAQFMTNFIYCLWCDGDSVNRNMYSTVVCCRRTTVQAGASLSKAQLGNFITITILGSVFQLEDTMIFNDFIVELAEDALVIVDKTDKVPGNVAKVALANSETRRNLHVLHCSWDDLLAEFNNPLLK